MKTDLAAVHRRVTSETKLIRCRSLSTSANSHELAATTAPTEINTAVNHTVDVNVSG